MSKSLVVCGMIAMVAASIAFGQEASPEGTPPAAPEPAYLRAWILPGTAKEPVMISLRRSLDEAPKVFVSSEAGQRSIGAGYNELPSGPAILEVRVGEQVVGSANLALRPRGHYTFAAWKPGSAWQSKMYSDAVAEGASDRPLRVLNFAGGRTTMFAPDRGQESKIGGNAVQEIRLPAKINGFTVRVLAPDGGPPAQTSAEVDFTEHASAYVVVVPDYRGRMRPEIIPGGAPKQDPAALAAAAAPQPPIDPVEQAKLERERMAANRRLERDHMAAQLAIVEAQIKEGINVPENAEGIRRELQQKVKELKAEAAPPPPVPAPVR